MNLIGKKINGNRVTVIDARKVGPNNYLVLCIGWNDITPFVVWSYNPDRDLCETGSYSDSLRNALQIFEARIHSYERGSL